MAVDADRSKAKSKRTDIFTTDVNTTLPTSRGGSEGRALLPCQPGTHKAALSTTQQARLESVAIRTQVQKVKHQQHTRTRPRWRFLRDHPTTQTCLNPCVQRVVRPERSARRSHWCRCRTLILSLTWTRRSSHKLTHRPRHGCDRDGKGDY